MEMIKISNLTLKSLTGTEKQNNWAESIRQQIINIAIVGINDAIDKVNDANVKNKHLLYNAINTQYVTKLHKMCEKCDFDFYIKQTNKVTNQFGFFRNLEIK